MRASRVHVERIDARESVHDGVDSHRADELADERVADVELQVVGPPQVVSRFADVDTDDLGDVGILYEALYDERTSLARDVGDEDVALLIGHRL